MSRETYVRRNGELIEKWRAPPLIEVHGYGPAVISDTMPALRHMASNKMFESKAAFRAETKAHGCREYGNEVAHLLKPRKPVQLSRQQRREDIKRSIYDLRNGIKRG